MIDLREMLKAGIHFGHKTSRWSPKMRPFIWGARNKIHLIDISKTAFLLERTGNYLKNEAAKGKMFLWVGTKRPAQKIIKKICMTLQMPYVINRWIGGTLSNFDQVKKAITRLLHQRDIVNKSTTSHTKKELVMIQKEIGRLERNIGGIISLQYPPAGIIVIDAKREQSAVREASRLGIPVIALVDTNTDPRGINFVIPANDDSPKSIQYIVDYLQTRIEEGIQLYKESNSEKIKEPDPQSKEVKIVIEKSIKEKASSADVVSTAANTVSPIDNKEKVVEKIEKGETKKIVSTQKKETLVVKPEKKVMPKVKPKEKVDLDEKKETVKESSTAAKTKKTEET
jgi:small subunit ribosomal protein S2